MARVKRKFLRDEIERQGYKYTEIAILAGLHRNTVSNIVTGKIRNPDFDTLNRIARVLSISVMSLIDEEF